MGVESGRFTSVYGEEFFVPTIEKEDVMSTLELLMIISHEGA
jgi:hypothetical protein